MIVKKSPTYPCPLPVRRSKKKGTGDRGPGLLTDRSSVGMFDRSGRVFVRSDLGQELTVDGRLYILDL